MKIINSQDYNNIDDFFNYYNECVKAEKDYIHSLHCECKAIDIIFDCDNVTQYSHFRYDIYYKDSLINVLEIKNIESINFWFISYQE